jgi:UPF0755 protein
MKKRLLYLFAFIILAGAATIYFVLGPATAFDEKNKYFIIEEGKTDKASVIENLENNHIISNGLLFSLIASPLHVWDKLKAGKYEVKQNESLLNIARMLKNNHQAQINLVIIKVRTKEELAKLIAKNFSSDSIAVMNFLTSNDSLSPYHVDTSKAFTIIIPDTYTFYWNTSLRNIFNRLYTASNNFWSNNNRLEKAAALGFTKEQAYILSSIVEEETNIPEDKGPIASVYINRLKKDMRLQACPTIKFSMKDFSLPRIYEKYLNNPSPYNTYRNKGLPPGPICTPSPSTIDHVLTAPKTDYLFFVATSDFSGHSHFSSNFAEHNKYAKEYQHALDIEMAKKKVPNP